MLFCLSPLSLHNNLLVCCFRDTHILRAILPFSHFSSMITNPRVWKQWIWGYSRWYIATGVVVLLLPLNLWEINVSLCLCMLLLLHFEAFTCFHIYYVHASFWSISLSLSPNPCCRWYLYDDAFDCIGIAIATATSTDVNASTTAEVAVFLCRIFLHVHAFIMLLHVHAFV